MLWCGAAARPRQQLGTATMHALDHDALSIEPSAPNSAAWIDEGQKYAMIALSVKLADPVPLQEMTPNQCSQF